MTAGTGGTALTLERAPGASRQCTYTGQRRCHAPAVGSIPESWAHPEWPLCEEHIKPKWHPKDLHDKLVTW